ncbi:septum formation initiator family protein [Candidatus Daviesbacteria bacterium]|nr:septum formation initiator family protein [Candidatus Daviesbacteria bacterium]
MVKKIVLGIIIFAVLIVAYNLIIQIMGGIKSGERLSSAADAVYKLEIKNKELKNKLAQIQSPEFLEEEIRNKLGFAKKGETIVVIPEEKIKSVLGTNSSLEVRLPNWLGWLKVFLK